MPKLRTKTSIICQQNPRQMHSNSKTSTFSSEVQVHFPASHCAHKGDCVKTFLFVDAETEVLAKVSKQRQRRYCWSLSSDF